VAIAVAVFGRQFFFFAWPGDCILAWRFRNFLLGIFLFDCWNVFCMERTGWAAAIFSLVGGLGLGELGIVVASRPWRRSTFEAEFAARAD